LITLLTNDVLKVCASNVNLEKLFYGHSVICSAALARSIDACEKWIKSFTEVQHGTPILAELFYLDLKLFFQS
jgi:hypothetical protein